MEFGLFFLMQRDEEWSEQSVFDSGLEQMLAAEALGYSSVWIAEHHFNDYGLCPAPPVLAAFVAARTTSLRLGMGVSLLPLHHPVDLAEELAVLDVVSGGRLDVGIGRGGTLQDYQTFQSDRDDSRARVEEGIALMRHSWSGAPFDFQGRFHSAERLQSFFVPVAELHKRHRLYRETARAAGRSMAEIEELEGRSWGMRVVHVAPDHDEALRATEAPFMGYQRRMSVLRSESTGGSVPGSFDRSLLRLRAFRDYLDDGWALIGTPDEVRDGLQKYCEATGYGRVLLVMALPGLRTDLALRSMRLFAEKVAPALA